MGARFRGDLSGSAGPARSLWEGLWEARLGKAAGVTAERGPAGLAWGAGREEEPPGEGRDQRGRQGTPGGRAEPQATHFL